MEITKCLLENDVDILLRNIYGQNALDCAKHELSILDEKLAKEAKYENIKLLRRRRDNYQKCMTLIKQKQFERDSTEDFWQNLISKESKQERVWRYI